MRDDKPLYNLTAKEFLILSRLVREIGRPVSQPEIWASGWGENQVFDHEASNLLRVHISTLRRKLSNFKVQILTKPNIGYTLTTMDSAFVWRQTGKHLQSGKNISNPPLPKLRE